ncbi:MAG: hypothetical protein ACRENV_09415 [Candidatus Dormibacteria bacterium]
MAARPSQAGQIWREALGLIALCLIQFLLGMGLNLFVAISRHHPGASGSDYFSRSLSSVVWGLTHFGLLAFHIGLGLVLFLGSVRLVVAALQAPALRLRIFSIVGALAVVAAGFNGASFLDFNENFSSMLMAVLFAIATFCFAVVLARAALGAGPQLLPEPG